MPVVVQCPTCGRQHAAGDHLLGSFARCPCGATLQIPRPATPPSTIRCGCPGCGRQHTVGREMAGQQARCSCGTIIIVPCPAPDPLDDMLKIDSAAAMLGNAAHAPVTNPYWLKEIEAEERRKKRRRKRKMPDEVSSACRALALPGAFSLVFAIFGVAVLIVDPDLPDYVSSAIVLLMTCYHLVAGLCSCGVAFLIAHRIQAGRYLGFFIAILYMCGSPMHIVAGIFAIVGLVSPEMAEFMED